MNFSTLQPWLELASERALNSIPAGILLAMVAWILLRIVGKAEFPHPLRGVVCSAASGGGTAVYPGMGRRASHSSGSRSSLFLGCCDCAGLDAVCADGRISYFCRGAPHRQVTAERDRNPRLRPASSVAGFLRVGRHPVSQSLSVFAGAGADGGGIPEASDSPSGLGAAGSLARRAPRHPAPRTRACTTLG